MLAGRNGFVQEDSKRYCCAVVLPLKSNRAHKYGMIVVGYGEKDDPRR